MYPVIQYRYTQLEYSFNETDDDTQVCLEIMSGNFVEGGYLTLAFFTSNFTATGQHIIIIIIIHSPHFVVYSQIRLACGTK